MSMPEPAQPVGAELVPQPDGLAKTSPRGVAVVHETGDVLMALRHPSPPSSRIRAAPTPWPSVESAASSKVALTRLTASCQRFESDVVSAAGGSRTSAMISRARSSGRLPRYGGGSRSRDRSRADQACRHLGRRLELLGAEAELRVGRVACPRPRQRNAALGRAYGVARMCVKETVLLASPSLMSWWSPTRALEDVGARRSGLPMGPRGADCDAGGSGEGAASMRRPGADPATRGSAPCAQPCGPAAPASRPARRAGGRAEKTSSPRASRAPLSATIQRF
jgi:hypothetical protein